MNIKYRRTLVGMLAIALAVPLSSAASASAEPASTPYCLAQAVSAERLDAQEQPTPVDCYTRFADVLRQAGYENVPDDIQPRDERPSSSMRSQDAEATMSFELATFYDSGPNPDATLTIVGNDCGGGGITFNSTWDNRFDAVQHAACRHIMHYYYATGPVDFHTYGNPGDFKIYPSTSMNKEDRVTFHNS